MRGIPKNGESMAARRNRRTNEWDANWYNYGAAAPAVKPEVPEIPIEEQYYNDAPVRRKPQEKTEPKKQMMVGFVAEERKASSRIFKNIAFFAAVFAICSFVVMRYAQISSKNLENQTIAANIDNMETQAELLDVAINEAKDLTVLQVRAEELGLGFANTDQVRYITVEIPAEEAVAVEEGGFDILEVIDKVRDIFG